MNKSAFNLICAAAVMKAVLDTDAVPVEFPVRYVVGSLVIIAILGARYVILLSHGKRGKELWIEFIPSVGEIYENIQWKKTQKKLLEREKKQAEIDERNAESIRAAEAEREARIAREELRMAEEEKKRMEEYAKQAQPEPTPSERRIGRPPKQTGVKTKADFKFIAPLAMKTTNENQAFAPSPFKPLTPPPAAVSEPEDKGVNET